MANIYIVFFCFLFRLFYSNVIEISIRFGFECHAYIDNNISCTFVCVCICFLCFTFQKISLDMRCDAMRTLSTSIPTLYQFPSVYIFGSICTAIFSSLNCNMSLVFVMTFLATAAIATVFFWEGPLINPRAAAAEYGTQIFVFCFVGQSVCYNIGNSLLLLLLLLIMMMLMLSSFANIEMRI